MHRLNLYNRRICPGESVLNVAGRGSHGIGAIFEFRSRNFPALRISSCCINKVSLHQPTLPGRYGYATEARDLGKLASFVRHAKVARITEFSARVLAKPRVALTSFEAARSAKYHVLTSRTLSRGLCAIEELSERRNTRVTDELDQSKLERVWDKSIADPRVSPFRQLLESTRKRSLAVCSLYSSLILPVSSYSCASRSTQ